MELHFTPEQLARLSKIAKHAGTDTEHLVMDAALRLVDENARFRAAVREGIAQADRGELINDEDVRGWLVKAASKRERVIPKLPYVEVYRMAEPDGVQILRIWHGAQERPGKPLSE
jgi:predicted transcriptional regulator